MIAQKSSKVNWKRKLEKDKIDKYIKTQELIKNAQYMCRIRKRNDVNYK